MFHLKLNDSYNKYFTSIKEYFWSFITKCSEEQDISSYILFDKLQIIGMNRPVSYHEIIEKIFSITENTNQINLYS